MAIVDPFGDDAWVWTNLAEPAADALERGNAVFRTGGGARRGLATFEDECTRLILGDWRPRLARLGMSACGWQPYPPPHRYKNDIEIRDMATDALVAVFEAKNFGVTGQVLDAMNHLNVGYPDTVKFLMLYGGCNDHEAQDPNCLANFMTAIPQLPQPPGMSQVSQVGPAWGTLFSVEGDGMPNSYLIFARVSVGG